MEIVLGVLMFTGIVLALVRIILWARAWLVASGDVTISVNEGQKVLKVPAGGKLLGVWLVKVSRFSACGGGTCA